MGLYRRRQYAERQPGERDGAPGAVAAQRRHQDGRAHHGTAQIDYNATEAALNTTGLLFKLYRDHFGTVPVAVDGNSPVPAPLYPVGADQPKVNAGSPTYPLDVTAALTADGRFLTVAVVNATESAQTLALSIKGIALQRWRMWLMTGPNLDAATGLDRQDVQIRESAIETVPNSLAVAPISISIYEFEKQ